MRRLAALIAMLCLAGLLCSAGGPTAKGEGEPAKAVAPAAPRRSVGDELAAIEMQRQRLAEREAALKAKEEELKKLSATLAARAAEMNSARKAVDASLKQKEAQDAERYRKVLKVYRGLKPDEAARLMDKLDDELAVGMLNRMDPKTAAKLIPFLNQQRVLRWTRQNLLGPAPAVALAEGRKSP